MRRGRGEGRISEKKKRNELNSRRKVETLETKEKIKKKKKLPKIPIFRNTFLTYILMKKEKRCNEQPSVKRPPSGVVGISANLPSIDCCNERYTVAGWGCRHGPHLARTLHERPSRRPWVRGTAIDSRWRQQGVRRSGDLVSRTTDLISLGRTEPYYESKTVVNRVINSEWVRAGGERFQGQRLFLPAIAAFFFLVGLWGGATAKKFAGFRKRSLGTINLEGSIWLLHGRLLLYLLRSLSCR